jgi:hypothetical protein
MHVPVLGPEYTHSAVSIEVFLISCFCSCYFFVPLYRAVLIRSLFLLLFFYYSSFILFILLYSH